ncbi:MAG: hypothetical protein R6W75_03125, partial [Smithellaceae bacterium]
MEEINHVVQGNAASAEEAAAAAQQMSAQCEAMKMYVQELACVIGETNGGKPLSLSSRRPDPLNLSPPGIGDSKSTANPALIEEGRS